MQISIQIKLCATILVEVEIIVSNRFKICTLYRSLEKHTNKKRAVVKIKEDNQLSVLWKLSIVTDIHPDKDGKVCACTIRLATGSFPRQAL